MWSFSRSLRLVVVVLLLLLPSLGRADAWLIDLEGPIGPAAADHMIRGLEQAQQQGAELVVLRIDTPGGLDMAMRDMIKSILSAELPIIGYVSPSGARAASAGTYLLYASHLAAMAPGTNLGAATPVQMGSGGLPGAGRDSAGEADTDAAAALSPMERKLVNDAVAYIQSLAQLRGRNAEWAEQAVRGGASLSAEDALALGVIDEIAGSPQELLASVHGREVSLGDTSVILDTRELVFYHHPVDLRSEFLAVITNPNIAYLLMLLGVYGLLIEFYNPGIGLPGVIGAFSLLLALYALQVLPVSYAGLGLMALGVTLMVAEALSPSFGIFGIGGIAAFATGSVMLMDTTLPGYRVALPMIAAVTVFSAAVLIFALGMMVKARRRPSVTGAAHLLGQHGVVESLPGDEIYVRLDGELWQARCDATLAAEDVVIVEAIEDLVLAVKKLDEGES